MLCAGFLVAAKNGICQRNIKRNCFSHAVVQVRSGTRDGLTVGQGCFFRLSSRQPVPEGIRSVRHSRCHHGIADENHALTSPIMEKVARTTAP